MATDQLSPRLLARHAHLVRALREAEIANVARAGARARLSGLDLLPGERAATRSARAAVGHALREARLRAKLPPAATESTSPRPAIKSRRRPWLAVLAGLLLLLLVAFGLVQRPETARSEGADPGGAPAGAGAVGQTQTYEHSRGRTAALVASVAVPSAAPSSEPTPAPTADKSAAPAAPGRAASSTAAGGGSSGGGAGGGAGGSGTGSGTGSGSGSGPGVATSAPTPAPTVAPAAKAAPGFTRIRGRVIDTNTGLGVAGVCIVPGSLDCDVGKPRSDANGYWVIDVTNGTYWDIKFQIDGYRVARIRVYAGGNDTNVGNVRIQRSTSTPTAAPPKP